MTIKQICLNIQQFVPEVDYAVVRSRLLQKYQTFIKVWQWSFREGLWQLYTKAPYSTGTVSVNAGSANVTGVGTTWTAGHADMYIKFGSEEAIYEIATVTPPTALTIGDNYGGASNLSASTYNIFQHIYTLSSEVKEVKEIIYQTRLVERSVAFIEALDPEQNSTGTPWVYAKRGLDSSGDHQIQIYPIPDAQYGLRINGERIISDPADSATPLINEELLEQSVLIDALRIGARKAKDLDIKRMYLNQIPVAAATIKDLWQSAIEEDFRKQSTSRRVRDYTETELPTYSDFWVDHDYPMV